MERSVCFVHLCFEGLQLGLLTKRREQLGDGFELKHFTLSRRYRLPIKHLRHFFHYFEVRLKETKESIRVELTFGEMTLLVLNLLSVLVNLEALLVEIDEVILGIKLRLVNL